MNQTPLAPMGVGKLLDRSFSVYRQHFGAFFLLALLLFGPLLLLQNLMLMDLTSMPFLYQETSEEEFWEALAERFTSSDAFLTESIALVLVYLFLILPIMTLVSYPQLVGSSLLMTRAVVDGSPVGIKQALRQSFSRFWPLAGSTILYILIMIGIFFAFTLFCVLFFFLCAVAIGVSFEGLFAGTDEVGSILAVLLILVAYLVFLVGVMLVPGFFILRWGFYLPYVLLEEEGVGLGKSWNLTKGNFWRLFALYFVLMVIYSTLSGGMQIMLAGALGTSLVSSLLQILISCLLMPWMMIVYALAYLDLRVRKEGTDLQALLNQQPVVEPATVPAQMSGEPHE